MRRLAVPDSDRRHRAQSGRVEDDVALRTGDDHDVVRELVLREDLVEFEARALRGGLREGALERRERAQGGLPRGAFVGVGGGMVGRRDVRHLKVGGGDVIGRGRRARRSATPRPSIAPT